ncbi:hypothetical protein D805_0643 [Bifidobacterium thermophilum RBL67]|uniref:Uncharacterized protein n=1 Tax=Bifidobacterium thermophilum RBL67 TaxID=1254439 RepID=M4RBS9_9BIFI|nr:hypothetical protein D805_0643 [Bifidobacterium thermophilum RBL67]
MRPYRREHIKMQPVTRLTVRTGAATPEHCTPICGYLRYL